MANSDQEVVKPATDSKPRRKFLVQPLETSSRTSRAPRGDERKSGIEKPGNNNSRRFAPDLIETTRRSRRKGDNGPMLRHHDKTDAAAGIERSISDGHKKPSDIQFDARPNQQSLTDYPSRFSASSLRRHAPRQSTIHKPTLDTISSIPELDEPDGAEPSQNSYHDLTKPANYDNMTGSQSSESTSQLVPITDTDFQHLAAKEARRQLENQVFATYPNESYHQPIDHFANDRDSDVSGSESEESLQLGSQRKDVYTHRRESSAAWHFSQAREFKIAREMQRNNTGTPVEPTFNPDKSSRAPANAINSLRGVGLRQGADHGGYGPRRRGEIQAVRTTASPPMLGRDIVFPRADSPKSTRTDATSDQTETMSSGTGLWSVSVSSEIQAEPEIKPTESKKPGLWGGHCLAKEGMLRIENAQSGLMTPRIERDNPFSQIDLAKLTPSKFQTAARLASPQSINQIISTEEELVQDFPDAFVTQVYNYLSLGYPSLGRDFDEELSKISKMEIGQIRHQDKQIDAKGYLGIHGKTDSSGNGQPCGRWLALRLYIREWARQQPRFEKSGQGTGWATIPRRGSWGI